MRPALEYCAPVWHFGLPKAQSERLEAVEKRTIHIVHNLTLGMPHSSMFIQFFEFSVLVEKIFLVVEKCFEYRFLSS